MMLEEAEKRINDSQKDAVDKIQKLEIEKNQQQGKINELTKKVENEKALLC